jgi:hypothetical protein
LGEPSESAAVDKLNAAHHPKQQHDNGEDEDEKKAHEQLRLVVPDESPPLMALVLPVRLHDFILK